MQSVRVLETSVVGQHPAEDEQAWRSLVQRIGMGDRQALAELYGRLQRPVYRYLSQLAREHGVAEEILQDTFLAVWKSAGSFEGRSKVQTWVFGIARRQAHNTLRRRGIDLAPPEALAQVVDPEPAVEDRALARSEADDLVRAIGLLSPVLQEVLTLNFVQGLSYSEIAEITGVPEGTVKSRLHGAKRALKQILCQFDQGPEGK